MPVPRGLGHFVSSDISLSNHGKTILYPNSSNTANILPTLHWLSNDVDTLEEGITEKNYYNY